MAKTKIEWCDYTINPVKGLCPAGCEYCYARRMYQRFKWNPEIRFDLSVFKPVYDVERPSRVFVGSTMELFGPWVRPEWLWLIFNNCERAPRHTFLFLTKRPEALSQWVPFPENAWAGVTVTTQADILCAVNHLMDHRIAQRQFLSIEPLLHWDTSDWYYPLPWHISKEDLDWIIIGQQTPVRKATMPKVEWIREIVHAADQAGIPVFLKDNLRPLLWAPLTGQAALDTGLLNWAGELRQEFPE